MKHFVSIIAAFIVINFAIGQAKKPAATKTVSKPETETSTPKGESRPPIPITLKPYKNTWVYLGSYYGKGKTLIDSAYVDENSKGVFKPKQKYVGGIYFVVSPHYAILFELLMDEKQQFSISFDTTKKEDPVITGSQENDLFKSYSLFSVEKGRKLNELNESYKKASNKADSTKFRDEIIKENKALETYRADLIAKHPKSLLAALLNAMKTPDYPAIPVVNGKADSLYPYHFVKNHYWDDVEFNDDRLLRTPFFETKIDTYFKQMISADPDSIFNEINYMMLYARSGKEMYPYLLTKFTNKFMSPEIMGQDKVFIKIFESFYAKGDTTLLNAASRKTIIERYYSMIANQVGSPAPQLDLTDTSGKTVSLYKLPAKYTFLVFWDPTCGHCKEELPKIDSIYRARWKDLGFKVYSINVSTAANTADEMKKFIHEKNLSKDWYYTAQTKAARDAEQAAGLPNYRQLFDVYKTPTLYLLDDKKQIIAKQLTIYQFNDIISMKLKKEKK